MQMETGVAVDLIYLGHIGDDLKVGQVKSNKKKRAWLTDAKEGSWSLRTPMGDTNDSDTRITQV